MKKYSASVPLDDVFPSYDRDPKSRASQARARLEVRLAVEIARARERCDMTQKQLAKALGTTQSVISRIENGDQNMTLETLGRLAEALGLELVPLLIRRRRLVPKLYSLAYGSRD